eukprot:gene20696-27500_t
MSYRNFMSGACRHAKQVARSLESVSSASMTSAGASVRGQVASPQLMNSIRAVRMEGGKMAGLGRAGTVPMSFASSAAAPSFASATSVLQGTFASVQAGATAGVAGTEDSDEEGATASSSRTGPKSSASEGESDDDDPVHLSGPT